MFLTVLLLSGSSCFVANYQPITEDLERIPPHEKTLESLFLVVKRSYQKEVNAVIGAEIAKEEILSTAEEDYQILKNALQRYSSAQTIVAATKPEPSHTFVKITLYYNYAASYNHKGWCEASVMSLAIIPCYGDLFVYETAYALYIDNVFQKEYHYRYAGKGIFWIGLFPFAWINFFTNSHGDALASTVYYFLRDAQRDGIFI